MSAPSIKPLFLLLCFAGLTASAAPTLRKSVDQRGDILIIGNTLGYDCATGTTPVVGTPTGCGSGAVFSDSSPDWLWMADSPGSGAAVADTSVTPSSARSTAVLTLPAGATVTYARLYWAAERATSGAGTSITVERPSVFSTTVAADVMTPVTYSASQFVYQSSADVTSVVRANGSGAYRITGVDMRDPRGLNDSVFFAGWSMVVFYRLDSLPPHNLTLFDGLDTVSTANPQVNSTITGFLVPNSGFDAKLGVVVYEGDSTLTGDAFYFNSTTTALSNTVRSSTNFFNGSRTGLAGTGVSNPGDLPQLTGNAGSMGGIDIAFMDVTSRLSAGATSATTRATSSSDTYFLGVFTTSITTLKPVFTDTVKTVTDLNGGDLREGDTVEYTISTTNGGTDDGVDVVMTDALPSGLTYVPGTLSVTYQNVTTALTDASGDDLGEYVSGTRTVTVRLGTGASTTAGGTISVNGSASVTFRATINAGTSTTTIANQAFIGANGATAKAQGVPAASFPSSTATGTPPGSTNTPVDQCSASTDCNGATPFCNTSGHPYRCVQCLANTACSNPTPACDAATSTCVACSNDASCTNNPATPACTTTGPVAGSCTQCSASNSTLCTGATPACRTSTGTCVQCVSDAQCSGINSSCNASSVCVRPTPLLPPVISVPGNNATVGTRTPVISGTVEANTTVTIYIDGVAVGTASAGASGTYSFTVTTPLTDGPHDITATATDAANNVSVVSGATHIVVDTTAPGRPVISTPVNGSATQSSQPPLSGSAEPNSTVTITVDGNVVGTTTADSSGNWAFNPPTPLPQGPHTVTVTATDAGGNVSPTSSPSTFTVDTTPPTLPTVTSPAAAAVVGSSTPTFTGTGEAGSTVTVVVDGVTLGTAVVNSAGQWSSTAPVTLAQGAHTVSVSAADAAGNTAGPTSPSPFTIDSAAPSAPTLSAPVAGAVLGTATPTLSGTAEAGSTVTVIVDGVVLGTTLADGSGNWIFTPPVSLADGNHTVSITARDDVGNSSPATTSSFVTDTTAPGTPVITAPSNGSSTRFTEPLITGNAEPFATVTVTVDGVVVGTVTADASGHFSYALTPEQSLTEGVHTVTATATDGLGHVSPVASSTFTVDLTPPAAPTIVTPAPQTPSDSSTPIFTGIGQPGDTITILVDGQVVGTGTVDETGHYSVTPTAPISNGQHTVTVQETDAAGNVSETTSTFLVDAHRFSYTGGGCASTGNGGLAPLGALLALAWLGRRRGASFRA